MPIEGRSARECAERFRAHIARLLANTVAPAVPLLLYGSGTSKYGVAFMRGDKPTTVPLETRYGRLYLHLAQVVEAEKIEKRFRLRTLEYWYRLQSGGGLREGALLRWEYERVDPTIAGPPRHHLHTSAVVRWRDERLDLDKVHTPSGWVTIEELIRFVIVELGTRPVSADWPKIVAESEGVFFQDFSGKRRVARAQHKLGRLD